MTAASFSAELLRRAARAFANDVVARLTESHRGLLDALPATFAAPAADLEVRVLQLAEAVAVQAPELYADAMHWYRVAYAHRGVPAGYLATTFDALVATLLDRLPAAAQEAVAPCVGAPVRAACAGPVELPSELAAAAPHVDLARRVLLAVLEDRIEQALQLVRRAVDDGLPLAELHDHVIAKVQREVGRMWLMAEIPIADEHLASAVATRILHLVQERLPAPPPDAPRVVCFGVGGDLHDVGIRVVAQRLQLAGFAAVQLGANLPPHDLEWAFGDRVPRLVAVSASMLLHVGTAAATVATLHRAFGAGRPRILVGGRPFGVVPDLHCRIGADAGAADAEAAVREALRLVQ